MKLDAVLVPLDGSTLAEMALPRATELAQASGARVYLVRASEARTLAPLAQIEAQVRVMQEVDEYLFKAAERLRASGVKDVRTAGWYGRPAAAIIEAAHLYKADLIVMTSHGRSGLGRLVLGSVAESVLRGTTTPILLLRAAEAPVETPAGSASPSTSGAASRGMKRAGEAD